jgi:hypothetical protein
MRLIKLLEDKETFPAIKGISGANYIYGSDSNKNPRVKSKVFYGYYFDSYEDMLEPLYLFVDKRNNFLKTK